MSIDVSVWVWKFAEASGARLLVLLALADIANHEGVCWPSIPTLAVRTRLHEQTVRGHLTELRELGAIEIEAQPGRSNRYTVLMPTPTDMATPSDFRRGTKTTQSTPTSVIPLPGTEPLKTNSKGTVSEPSLVVDAAFDAFWAVYPRHVGKAAARKSFLGQARKVDPRVIVDGARRFAADPNLPEKQFVPHPTTWLNQGRWDDEDLPPREGGGSPAPLAPVSPMVPPEVQAWLSELRIPVEEYMERRNEPGWVESMRRRARG